MYRHKKANTRIRNQHMIGVKIAKLAEDVPCVVVFRALAMSNIADREVLEPPVESSAPMHVSCCLKRTQ